MRFTTVAALLAIIASCSALTGTEYAHALPTIIPSNYETPNRYALVREPHQPRNDDDWRYTRTGAAPEPEVKHKEKRRRLVGFVPVDSKGQQQDLRSQAPSVFLDPESGSLFVKDSARLPQGVALVQSAYPTPSDDGNADHRRMVATSQLPDRMILRVAHEEPSPPLPPPSQRRVVFKRTSRSPVALFGGASRSGAQANTRAGHMHSAGGVSKLGLANDAYPYGGHNHYSSYIPHDPQIRGSRSMLSLMEVQQNPEDVQSNLDEVSAEDATEAPEGNPVTIVIKWRKRVRLISDAEAEQRQVADDAKSAAQGLASVLKSLYFVSQSWRRLTSLSGGILYLPKTLEGLSKFMPKG
ncbi:hypothetical protein THASP1DRAFT_22749 [Thamnocephalis sphaerospora]|uniref:Uncharacterized protein n=1 Tax=Thamnocephalis sphaerospora TaxID=78915 RepID=A0A4V1IX07_9FUNG|nr:hypothetical protein THASP1DRAFT_22749 [Thamnocephalis sphaerospora]|eukprot:RKP09399.1 hypothetical protein THASP1DRAFT_22749 [Thamnocephalis sphaerospora]